MTLSNVSKKNERKSTGVKGKLSNDQMGDLLCSYYTTTSLFSITISIHGVTDLNNTNYHLS